MEGCASSPSNQVGFETSQLASITALLPGATTYFECADYKGRKWCATSLNDDGTYKGYGYCDVDKCKAGVGK